jgi:N-acyl-D-aspartate/D-glutamate deacylase
MVEYDLIIRNGTIVDGSRLPAYRADLAVQNGKIAKISGNIKAKGKKEIDATGKIVAPGAVDLHTHYDAQINWDPYCTLSGWHGVTTLTIGQCGFGFAPCKPEDRELNMRMMDRVEAIPYESMAKGMRWDWISFPEYLNSLERQGLGLNVGSLFPYSPLRAFVLGAREARERTKVTEKELAQLKHLFREGMQAGAFGFSADKNLIDRPEDGSFLPTHVTSNEEFLALAEIQREFGVGHVGWTVGELQSFGGDPFLIELIKTSGRPVQWGAIAHTEQSPDTWKVQLNWVEEVNKQGYPMYAQCICMDIATHFSLAEYNLFDDMPNWVQPLVGTPEERAAKLRKPEVRAAMKKDIAECTATIFHKNWNKVKILEVHEERNRKYEGLSVAQLAEMTGKDPLDAWLDFALDDGLKTEFGLIDFVNGDKYAVGEILKHPFTHLSVSDGGAHTKYLTISAWPTYFLSHWIRDEKLMSLEDAHWKMSALPAWLIGLRDRGLVREGMAADIIVYDFDKLGMQYDTPVYANDFPGGERRLIQKPVGLHYTLVNGVVTFEDGNCSGALPGKLLRSTEVSA